MIRNGVARPIPPVSEWIDKPASERVAILGHRAFIGANNARMWYDIARRQFHFLVSQGVRPEHRFVDVACGSLRLGQFMIPYLDKGHYFGLEAEPSLVEAGLKNELLFDLADQKAPSFGHGYAFDFSFVPEFDAAIAQSLFTHLTEEDIATCLTNLRPKAHAGSRFFFTFFNEDKPNPDEPSHANKVWYYPFSEIERISKSCGWKATYIGDWGHERNQEMAVVSPL